MALLRGLNFTNVIAFNLWYCFHQFFHRQAVLANYIGEKLDEWSVDENLYKNCQNKAEDELLDEADTATVILSELWKRLQETQRLRIFE
jgi:hypothetical protein